MTAVCSQEVFAGMSLRHFLTLICYEPLLLVSVFECEVDRQQAVQADATLNPYDIELSAVI